LDRAVAGWWRRFHSVYVWSLSNRRPREIEGGERPFMFEVGWVGGENVGRLGRRQARRWFMHVRGRSSGRWKRLQILISY
jgi:hypothetical protein